MEGRRKPVYSKMARELASEIIGTKKIDMQDDMGYYFSVGSVRLRIMKHCTVPTYSTFRVFDVKGKRYEGQALDCTLFIGNYVNHDLFYTLEGHQEIYHEYAED